MENFFKIVGIIVVAWIVLGLLGWLLVAALKIVFWIALIAGIAYIVASLVVKKNQVGKR